MLGPAVPIVNAEPERVLFLRLGGMKAFSARLRRKGGICTWVILCALRAKGSVKGRLTMSIWVAEDGFVALKVLSVTLPSLTVSAKALF